MIIVIVIDNDNWMGCLYHRMAKGDKNKLNVFFCELVKKFSKGEKKQRIKCNLFVNGIYSLYLHKQRVPMMVLYQDYSWSLSEGQKEVALMSKSLIKS